VEKMKNGFVDMDKFDCHYFLKKKRRRRRTAAPSLDAVD
jgi:hypothetical protein